MLTEGSFLVVSLEKREAKNKNEFLAGQVANKQRQVAVCIWDTTTLKEFNNGNIKPGMVLTAEWDEKEFKNEPQLDVKKLLKIEAFDELTPERKNDLLKASLITKEEWLRFYNTNILPLLEDESVAQAIKLLAIDDENFWRAPAAKSMHHNFIGGLAEHTLNLLKIFWGLLQADHMYIKKCRKDLVVAGLILHDLGKIWEYEEVAPGQFDYTRFGNLLGHLAGGPIIMAKKMVKAGLKFSSKELEMHFWHVLLAHHGILEWGSPVTPKTQEAWIVHTIDNFDGKLFMYEETKDAAFSKGLRSNVYKVNTPE